MPLIAFKPTKARLVIEQGRESVLVMRVVVAKGETVALAAGGRLESTSGFLRIRERKEERGRNENKAVGSIVFVTCGGRRRRAEPRAISRSTSRCPRRSSKRCSRSRSPGRLPSKFFVHAGDRISARETRGMGYAIRAGVRIKFWDNQRFRIAAGDELLGHPADLRPRGAARRPAFEEDRALVESLSSNDQVAELADEFAVFQGETKNALTAVVSVVAVIGVLLLFINLVLIIK